MKQGEFKKCAQCGKGMAGKGVFFYRIKIEQMILDFNAIRRAHGLELMMGGSASLAQVMGPDEDLAVSLGALEVLVCANCGISLPHFLHDLPPEDTSVGDQDG